MSNLESNSYDENDMQKKVLVAVSLHEAMQKKLKAASYSETNQILTLLDKWSQMYCSEYFSIFEYLAWTSQEIKKVGEILAKPVQEKRRRYHQWNT